MSTSRSPLARAVGSVGLAAALLLGLGPGEPLPRPPAAAAEGTGPAATVTIHGRAGSFGSPGQTLPSGQPLAQHPVPDWRFPGVQAGATAVAADGTVFVAGRDHHGGGGPPTSGSLLIGAYQPGAGGYTPIRIPTAAGAEVIVDAGGDPLAPSIADLAPVAGGEAVAFTVGVPPDQPGADRTWPVLGILTEVGGRWRVATGDGWANQWTAAQLGAGPELGELVALPDSGTLIVVQATSLLALRVVGPDPDGRYDATVTDRYEYPEVVDPETGDHLDLTLRDLQADPTSERGGERFMVGLLDAASDDPDRAVPGVVQEFSYDADAGTIAPVSAPTIPGDRAGERGAVYGYSATLYDRDGNLWAARHRWLAGGKLAVYSGGMGCRFDPAADLSSYVTTFDDRTVWGQACRPDYDIVQAQDLALITSLVQDPVGGEVVGLALVGVLLPVRVAGDGELVFEVGNLVDTGPRLLPTGDGSVLEHRFGGFDRDGRLWFAAAQGRPREAGGEVDQWLYEVDTGALFEPAPVGLPDVPGRSATVQVGHTVTVETEQLAGAWARVEVNSLAHVRGCGEDAASVGCSYDGVPGDGFLLSDRSGYGHLSGEVAYRVEVPTAGSYRVGYRVHTFPTVTEAEITLSVDGQTATTPVTTGGQWRTVPQSELVDLPAGVHTIRLSAVDGHGGWHLSWFTLQRG
jgi:hypothetical protein